MKYNKIVFRKEEEDEDAVVTLEAGEVIMEHLRATCEGRDLPTAAPRDLDFRYLSRNRVLADVSIYLVINWNLILISGACSFRQPYVSSQRGDGSRVSR